MARAEGVDCPPGSVSKSAGRSTYCEPSVCTIDAQCQAGEVCRPLPLCVEIGSSKGADMADGGSLLIARQRCGADEVCPSSTQCLDGSRCVAKALAERLAAPDLASKAGDPPVKKSCGCRVAGAPSGGGNAALLGLGLAVVALDRRRSAKRV